MRRIFFILTFFVYQLSFSQEIDQRLIVFGDAGEMNNKQSFLIENSFDLQIPQKTKVFFIGDNIYPSGMGLEEPERSKTEDILKSQFEGFRNLGLPVYFLAGNHDWDHSGKNGLAKLKVQEHFINDFRDSDLQFLPSAGSIGPKTISINKNVIAIVYDSEYWLFPHHEHNIDQDKNKFIEDLKNLLDQNKEKTILLVSHHPMSSYGDHSLIYNWKDHIFPLTDVSPSLYIPLPGLGSLYPLFRSKVFKSPEDLKHPLYADLIQRVTSITKDHPRVLFISGHDHGLQYISSGNIRQIVSGSGSKQSDIHQRKPLKYGYNKQGFCVVDIMENDDIRVTFYIDKPKNTLTKDFETVVDFAAEQ